MKKIIFAALAVACICAATAAYAVSAFGPRAGTVGGPPPSGSALLLVDGVSNLLLIDGTDHLCLAQSSSC
jgi:hypothetical protein